MNLFPVTGLARKILSVSELNNSTRQFLEQNIPLLWVKGEISNLKRYQSGHWYFSLKDAEAQVRCVLFSHKNRYFDWQPVDGMQVEVLALVTLYEPRGDFQLNVETIRRAGLGELFEAFEKLKAKLEKAGFFNPDRKKKLPDFPKQIGIITSLDTAALRDVLSTLRRRMPSLPVIIYPTLVQGKTAAASIADAIDTAVMRNECDVLIVCRGGGNIEDLWAFNEEIVALAIAGSSIPVVSGIGHETDFTIADFVADMRAPTPTAAAELVSKDQIELSRRLNTIYQRMFRMVLHGLERAIQRVDILSHRLIYPGNRIQQQHFQLQYLQDRLNKNYAYLIEKKQWVVLGFNQRLVNTNSRVVHSEQQHQVLASRFLRAFSLYFEAHSVRLKHIQAQLSQLNPQSVLKRGYSITFSDEGTIIRNSKQIHCGEKIQVKFGRGCCEADVSNVKDS